MVNRQMFALCAALLLAQAVSAQTQPTRPLLDLRIERAAEAVPSEVLEEPPLSVEALFSESGYATKHNSEPLWVSGEYLLAWFRSDRLPQLASTSVTGTSRANAGVLGTPGSRVLFGDRGGEFGDVRSGMNITGGMRIRPDVGFGFEAGLRFIESQANGFVGNSTGDPILARPFVNANTGQAAAVQIAFPDVSAGGLEVRAFSSNFWDGCFTLSQTVADQENFRIDALLGYRVFRYNEGLTARQFISPLDPLAIPGTRIAAEDTFRTLNEFHGADIGLRARMFFDKASITVLGKVSLGNMHKEVTIRGFTVSTVPGQSEVVRLGGVLALPSNLGTLGDDYLGLIPELNALAHYHLTSNIRVSFGYSVIVMPEVARVGKQVDLVLNPNLFPGPDQQLTGPLRPAAALRSSYLWMQSLNFGLQFVY